MDVVAVDVPNVLLNIADAVADVENKLVIVDVEGTMELVVLVIVDDMLVVVVIEEEI